MGLSVHVYWSETRHTHPGTPHAPPQDMHQATVNKDMERQQNVLDKMKAEIRCEGARRQGSCGRCPQKHETLRRGRKAEAGSCRRVCEAVIGTGQLVGGAAGD